MRLIVIGGGRTVYFLSRQFIDRGHQVTIIDQDGRDATSLSHQVKATVVVGDGTDPMVLEEAGVRRAEVVLALTGHDQDNLVACQISHQIYQVPRTMALVNDPDNEEIFLRLGITAVFSTTQIITQLIEHRAGFEEIQSIISAAGGRIAVSEVILREDAPAVDKEVQELDLPEGALLGGVLRGEEVIIPRGSTRLLVGDHLLVISLTSNYSLVMETLTGERR